MAKLTIKVNCRKCDRKIVYNKRENSFWCQECNIIYYTNLTDMAYFAGIEDGKIERSQEIRKMLGL